MCLEARWGGEIDWVLEFVSTKGRGVGDDLPKGRLCLGRNERLKETMYEFICYIMYIIYFILYDGCMLYIYIYIILDILWSAK